MFRHLSDPIKGALFYVIAFALALVIVALPGAAETERTLLLTMFTPLVAVLLMLLVFTRDGYSRKGWASLGLHRLGLRGWLLAIFVPLLVLGASYAVVWGTGLATFGVSEQHRTVYGDAGVPLVLLMTLVGIARSTLTNSLAEELGWRGYLLPRLIPLGTRRSMFVTGLLHGIWHLPVMLLTPLYHAEGNQLIVVPLFLLSLTVAGGIYGYLRVTTDSVWPASIGHSAHNAFWELFSGLTIASTPLASEYLAGESGILPTIGYALVAAVLLYRLSSRERATPQPAAATV
jgi:uncharacterized protein